MKRIAIVEDGYVRDAQIYTGSIEDIKSDPNWENKFVDMKATCQFIGVIEGESEADILRKAANLEGVHPDIITLISV